MPHDVNIRIYKKAHTNIIKIDDLKFCFDDVNIYVTVDINPIIKNQLNLPPFSDLIKNNKTAQKINDMLNNTILVLSFGISL